MLIISVHSIKIADMLNWKITRILLDLALTGLLLIIPFRIFKGLKEDKYNAG